ncbi:MAG TPA: DUF72 domain-containing protein, partial [Gemmatimonadaceae bacterium]|nr:DUF72 domain-containing protein [Gemmatimonadaceae bacterium]
ELEPWAARTKEVAASAEHTFVITNNHYKGKAAANALMLEALVGGKKPRAPEALVKEYEAELADVVRPVKPI